MKPAKKLFSSLKIIFFTCLIITFFLTVNLVKAEDPDIDALLNDTIDSLITLEQEYEDAKNENNESILSLIRDKMHNIFAALGELTVEMRDGSFNQLVNADGKVGVGTTDPEFNFEVKDYGRIAFDVTDPAHSGDERVTRSIINTPKNSEDKSNMFVWFANKGASWVPKDALTLYQYPSDQSGGCCHKHAVFGIREDGSNYQYFSGDVGIGTQTPSVKLQVQGTILSAVDEKIQLGDNNVHLKRNATNDNMEFHAGAAAETRMSINYTNGNVGIGTTDPKYRLDVKDYGRVVVDVTDTTHSGDNKVTMFRLFTPTSSENKMDDFTWFVNENASWLPKRTMTLYQYPSDKLGGCCHKHAVFGIKNDGSNYQYFSGNVGIGEHNPSNILAIKRNSLTDPIADAWASYSSRRWKTNIITIADALSKVQELRGVTFDWKEDGKHDIGLIAEEVGEVVPELVEYEENGIDAKSVDYARLSAVLIEAVKEQQKIIEDQKAEMEEIEARLSAIEELIAE